MAVKLDLRNAYNAISRQTDLRRVAAVPSLAHLVPFLHAQLFTLALSEHEFQKFFQKKGSDFDYEFPEISAEIR